MIIKDVRVDWLFVFDTGKQGKYGCAALLPKGSAQDKQVQEAIAQAKEIGIASGKFNEAQTKSASFKKCLRDGDAEIESEGRPGHYKGMNFFNCSNASQPGIIGPDLSPMITGVELYSGCYCNLDVNITPFHNVEHNSRGVGAYLNNIMLVRAGERLDGRQAADEAFAGMETTDAGDLV